MADVLRANWGKIAAADFFTTEVLTARGLVTYFTLFVLDLCMRRVQVAGSTPHPDGAFMAQAARYLTDAVDGFLTSHHVLILTATVSGHMSSARCSREPGCGSS